ncbi:hypothetical protein PAPYR_4045 [Paratrimastix pyriformis]|uniref:Uncharacterized protein n=1 Tax=Paratrimastix pyriformis TaxID=342808 RepID=A0ABQ8UL96_9EUKA|nr:hypothetical protein PAPYR_4045 [Paratrimastix pyriformis]
MLQGACVVLNNNSPSDMSACVRHLSSPSPFFLRLDRSIPQDLQREHASLKASYDQTCSLLRSYAARAAPGGTSTLPPGTQPPVPQLVPPAATTCDQSSLTTTNTTLSTTAGGGFPSPALTLASSTARPPPPTLTRREAAEWAAAVLDFRPSPALSTASGPPAMSGAEAASGEATGMGSWMRGSTWTGLPPLPPAANATPNGGSAKASSTAAEAGGDSPGPVAALLEAMKRNHTSAIDQTLCSAPTHSHDQESHERDMAVLQTENGALRHQVSTLNAQCAQLRAELEQGHLSAESLRQQVDQERARRLLAEEDLAKIGRQTVVSDDPARASTWRFSRDAFRLKLAARGTSAPLLLPPASAPAAVPGVTPNAAASAGGEGEVGRTGPSPSPGAPITVLGTLRAAAGGADGATTGSPSPIHPAPSPSDLYTPPAPTTPLVLSPSPAQPPSALLIPGRSLPPPARPQPHTQSTTLLAVGMTPPLAMSTPAGPHTAPVLPSQPGWREYFDELLQCSPVMQLPELPAETGLLLPHHQPALAPLDPTTGMDRSDKLLRPLKHSPTCLRALRSATLLSTGPRLPLFHVTATASPPVGVPSAGRPSPGISPSSADGGRSTTGVKSTTSTTAGPSEATTSTSPPQPQTMVADAGVIPAAPTRVDLMPQKT